MFSQIRLQSLVPRVPKLNFRYATPLFNITRHFAKLPYDFSSLVEMQQKSVEKNRDRPFLGTKINGEYKYKTFGEFGAEVDKMRAALAKLGVTKGDAVAVISRNSFEWVVSAYGTYGLGALYVPMYEQQKKTDWKHILADCGAKICLVRTETIQSQVQGMKDGSLGPALNDLEHIICFEAAEDDEFSIANQLKIGEKNPIPAIFPSSDDLAGFLYTSGTTGAPKGVELTHDNFCSNVKSGVLMMPEEFGFSENDRSLSFVPWAHSYGQTCELHFGICVGASAGLAEDITTIPQNLLEVKPTALYAVPKVLSRVYVRASDRVNKASPLKQKLFKLAVQAGEEYRLARDAGKEPGFLLKIKHSILDKVVLSKIRAVFGGNIRIVISAGAACSFDVLKFIENIGIPVMEGYGLTETSPITTMNVPNFTDRLLGSVGRAIPDVEVIIRDPETGKILPQGTEGEVCIYGPNVMRGYHNLPVETEKVMTYINEKRYFRTGDVGYINLGGFLKITDRFKEIFKLENGKYVAPQPIELDLELSPLIEKAMVFGANKPFNIVVIHPNPEVLFDWAKKELKIEEVLLGELIQHPAVYELYLRELENRSKKMKRYEVARDVILVQEPFTVENGMLTPKQSLKRRNIVKRYEKEIETIYQKGPPKGVDLDA